LNEAFLLHIGEDCMNYQDLYSLMVNIFPDDTIFSGVKKLVDEFFINDNTSLEKSCWIYYKNK